MYPLLHDQSATAAGQPGGLARHRWRRLLGVLLVGLLAVACTGQDGRQGAAISREPATGPAQRDYWPTAGWRTAAPGDQGMDPQVLGDLDTQVPQRHLQVRSLLVVRHGYLVYERYWHGFDAADGHELHSITKSVTSALVGIALGERYLKSLDQTVGELLAHLPEGADPRLRAVTVRQLLTMTGGLAGDDPSTGGDARLSTRLFRSRDWVGHILGRPLADNPGTTFAYSNASSHLLSAIVADATGQSTLAYARARLFNPLGINSEDAFQPRAGRPPTPAQLRAYRQAAVAWPRDPQGYHMGFGETKLPARDLAKFGYLYLNGGRWDTTQVVPADYVRASTQPQRNLGGPRVGYGYQWWTTSINLHAAFAAMGIGGQRIVVVPDLDLVVVITSDAQQQREDAEELVGQTIIPAVTS